MLRQLRRLFGKGEVLREFSDPVVGKLVFYADRGWWESQLTFEGAPVTIAIGGGTVPDPGLLHHARDIIARFAGFDARVRAFLEQEALASRFPEEATEIRSLRIESVNLCWPKRPDDGMIFFSGSSEDRMWRCDYVGREPRGLGCDS